MAREVVIPGITRQRRAGQPPRNGQEAHTLLRKAGVPISRAPGEQIRGETGGQRPTKVFGADLAVPLGDVKNSLTSVKDTKVSTSGLKKGDPSDSLTGTDT